MKISQGFYEEKDSVTERSRGASSQTPNPPVDKTYPTSYEEVSSRIARVGLENRDDTQATQALR